MITSSVIFRGGVHNLTNKIKSIRSLYRAQVVFFAMPKVASQSIKEALNRNSDLRAGEIRHSFHPSTVRRLLQMKENSFKFTFVRHPYTRFISSYNWATRKSIDPIKHPNDVRQAKIVNSYKSMEDFCDALASGQIYNQESLLHFVPQSQWVYKGNERLLNYVGKLENLEASVEELGNLGVSLELSYGPNAKSPSPAIALSNPIEVKEKLNLSNRLIRSINSYYAKDFINFNYKFLEIDE